MEGINKKYNLEIEVLTPLSIGAGQEKDWARGVDFVVDNGKLYKLNLKKMVANGVNVDDLTSYFALKNEAGLKSKLAGKLDLVSDFSIPFPVESDYDVKAFVKNQLTGNPVLPGSSLKGSVRSVLLDYLATKEEINNAVSEASRRRRPFESFIFGSSNTGDEFMRFIKITDAEFDRTELVNTKVFNLRKSRDDWQGGWKHQQTNREGNSFTDGHFKSSGFNALYECLVPKQKGYASLMMSKELYDVFERNNERHLPHIKTEKKRPILQNDIRFLFGIINQHTKDYLKKEKAFFEKYATDRTGNIVSSIESLLFQIPTDNSCCILKMSAGSGFHSITGDWQFDDYSQTGTWTQGRNAGKKKYKSRKIADCGGNLSLMGFVKLRALSEEEVKHLEEERQAERQRKEQERLAELEANRIKAEEDARAQREKEERQELYTQAIAEVKQLENAERYEDALSLFQSAREKFPECEQLGVNVDLLKEKVKLIQEKRAIEKRQQEEAEQKRLENAIPLSEKIAKVQKLPTLYGNVKQWMKQNGFDVLSEKDLGVLLQQIQEIVNGMKEKERKGLKSLGKDLDLLVGSDTATKWFKEIVKQ